MSPRTGRPPVENKKERRFSIRLDEEMFYKLNEYCQVEDITKGEAIRRALQLLLEK